MRAQSTLLSRLRAGLEQRKVLPYREQPPPRTRAERGRWLALCLAAWITMAGALLATLPLIEDRVFLLKLAAILAVAFPVSYYLHFTSFPRFWVNWATFAAAVVSGYLEMRANWPPGGSTEVSRLVLSYRTLVCLFYWVMVFRAFALRDVGDLAQSAIPAASGVLLVLIASPSALGLGGTALVILGTLALLAGEQAAARRYSVDEIIPQRLVRGGRWRPALNSWLALLLAVAVAGTAMGLVGSRMEMPNQAGRWLRAQLAWRLARLMMRESRVLLAEPVLALGGPAPRPRDRVLLTVRCELSVKMRSSVYETYDGGSWTGSRRRATRLTPEGDRWHLPPLPDFGLAPEATRQAELQVRSYTHFAGYLPIPWCAREIEFKAVSVRHDRAAVVHIGGHFSWGESYRALVAVPVRTSPARGAPEVPPVGVREALQLPDELPQRVRDLAQDITASAATARDKAMAVQTYLAEQCQYDLNAPELPRGGDFVDHFLFESRRGYCNHYASAMAVLLRAVGVPARLAAGFTAGRYDEGEDISVIRDQDAHSWVEVFIPRVGWVDFDPTPAGPERERGLLSRLHAAAARPLGRGARAALAWAVRHGIALAIVLSVLAVTALAARHARRWWRRRPRPLPPGAPVGDRVARAYRQAAEWLALRGMPREPATAPWEFFEGAAERFPPVAQDLALLTEKYLLARFGASALTESDAAAAAGALGRLREAVFAAHAGRT